MGSHQGALPAFMAHPKNGHPQLTAITVMNSSVVLLWHDTEKRANTRPYARLAATNTSNRNSGQEDAPSMMSEGDFV